MAVADRVGLPLAVHVASASPHEVTLAEATVAQRFVAPAPQRLIGDRAYDSDALDARFAAGEVRTIKARVRAAARARKVALPDPDEFVELMDRVRKKKR